MSGMDRLEAFEKRIMNDYADVLSLAREVDECAKTDDLDTLSGKLLRAVSLVNVITLSIARLILGIEDLLEKTSGREHARLRSKKGSLMVLRGDIIGSAKNNYSIMRLLEIRRSVQDDKKRSENPVSE